MSDIGDIIQVTFEGVILGQTWQMVQMVEVDPDNAAPPDASEWTGFLEGLDVLFNSWLTAGVKSCLSPSWSYTNVRAENLFSETEIGQYIRPTPVVGTGTGDSAPPYETYVYKVGSKRKGMRPGFKRMAGVIELCSGNGGEIAAVHLALLQPFGTALGGQWNVIYAPLTGVKVNPVILQRIPIPGTEDPIEYRLPTTQEEAVYYKVGTYTIVNYVNTTGSRKRGKGI